MKYLFLIQDELYDFCYETISACKYKNWYNNNNEYQYELMTLPLANMKQLQAICGKHGYGNFILKDIIPIGTVEFILNFYKTIWNINNIKPLNIPNELQNYDFEKRTIHHNYNIYHDKLNIFNPKDDLKHFIKSNDNIKDEINGFYYNKNTDIFYFSSIDKYLVSDLIDIDSEYRCFVCNGELLDCRCYSGDFKLQPNYDLIQKMIDKYPNKAYTLDVGINKKDGTFIIECHDFFSCGLYGFGNYNKIIQMELLTHHKILKENYYEKI